MKGPPEMLQVVEIHFQWRQEQCLCSDIMLASGTTRASAAMVLAYFVKNSLGSQNGKVYMWEKKLTKG